MVMNTIVTIEYLETTEGDMVVLTYLGCEVNYIISKKLSNVHHVKFYMRENVYNVHIKNDEPGGMKLLQCSDLVLAFYDNISYVNEYKYSFNLSNNQLSSIIPSLNGKYNVQRLSCIKCREFDPIEYPTNILYLTDKDDSISVKLLL